MPLVGVIALAITSSSRATTRGREADSPASKKRLTLTRCDRGDEQQQPRRPSVAMMAAAASTGIDAHDVGQRQDLAAVPAVEEDAGERADHG